MTGGDQDRHYRRVVRALAEGRVVPLLGAGVNLCDRPTGSVWDRAERQFLPSGAELATFLAESFEYPEDETTTDLLRVSQFASLEGTGSLYGELHKIFDADYAPSRLHRFLAALPGVLRDKGLPDRYQLIVTTNYDDALEAAFRCAGEPFDTVSYVADGKHKGKFMHRPPDWPPDEPARLIESPNEYIDVTSERRTVILKIHGAVDRRTSQDRRTSDSEDSYVITEDHYVDYLTRTDIAALLPIKLLGKLRSSHFLFLGYSLRDWNLRVILHRIWGEQGLNYKSWSVQAAPRPLDPEFWKGRNVEILDVRLEQYVERLQAQLEEPFGAGVG